MRDKYATHDVTQTHQQIDDVDLSCRSAGSWAILSVNAFGVTHHVCTCFCMSNVVVFSL